MFTNMLLNKVYNLRDHINSRKLKWETNIKVEWFDLKFHSQEFKRPLQTCFSASLSVIVLWSTFFVNPKVNLKLLVIVPAKAITKKR